MSIQQRDWRRRFRGRPRLRSLIGYASSLLGVAVLTWLISLIFPRLHITNISMIYLLLVLTLAVVFGSGPAIAASILAFLAFDVFFVEPVGSLRVNDPNEWLPLGLLLIVAIITGQLTATLHRREVEVQRRMRELAMLNELSAAILADSHCEQALQTIVGRAGMMVKLRYCAILIPDENGRLQRVASYGAMPLAEDGSDACPSVDAPQAERMSPRCIGGPMRLPLRVGDRTIGVLVAGEKLTHDPFNTHDERLLQACTDQAALALERARLATEERRVAVLEESDRVKSALLSSVSHELRTPLAVIRAAASGLQQPAVVWPDEAHRELAASIDREATRLNRLVGNLLHMSRIEAGALRPEMTPQPIEDVIGAVLVRLETMLRGYQLQLELPDDLPLVSFDAVQIDQVLTNLLENAVKFSPTGTSIRLRVRVVTGELRVDVENEGPLLSAEETMHIFDKFYQGQGQSIGSGLGLAICKGIIEAHGGRIWAENLPESGVRFAFALRSEGFKSLRR